MIQNKQGGKKSFREILSNLFSTYSCCHCYHCCHCCYCCVGLFKVRSLSLYGSMHVGLNESNKLVGIFFSPRIFHLIKRNNKNIENGLFLSGIALGKCYFRSNYSQIAVRKKKFLSHAKTCINNKLYRLKINALYGYSSMIPIVCIQMIYIYI